MIKKGEGLNGSYEEEKREIETDSQKKKDGNARYNKIESRTNETRAAKRVA